jgi:hypothetical protein
MNPLALLLLAVLPSLGFVAGVLLGRQRNPSELTKVERKELYEQRDLINELTGMAGEYISLNDPFAVVAMDRINQHRKEIR